MGEPDEAVEVEVEDTEAEGPTVLDADHYIEDIRAEREDREVPETRPFYRDLTGTDDAPTQ